MGMTLYGIKTCSTMQKARAWLDARGVCYRFHDYKRDGIDEALLASWCEELGWEKIINRAGTTFRKLEETQKADLDSAKARKLMQAQPSMIRRPILTGTGETVIGFSEERYAGLFPA